MDASKKRSDAAITGPPVIFACSPRPGGNSDTLARVFAAGIEEAGGAGRTVYLRDRTILPCEGCSACDPSGRCIFAERDDAESLFADLLTAPFVMFAAPIYFYHLPALFKGFIDRSQSYYVRSKNGEPSMTTLPARRAYIALCAGRPRGERLFEGSLLTLKYFLDVFRFSAHDPVLLRSMDGPEDFGGDRDAVSRVRSLGRAAWKQTHGDR
ncbi:flavodoxin family protein [Desulfoplanes sp.]